MPGGVPVLPLRLVHVRIAHDIPAQDATQYSANRPSVTRRRSCPSNGTSLPSSSTPTPVQRAATSAPSTSGPTAKVKSSVENIARVSRISSTSASRPTTSRSGQCPAKSSVRISPATSYEPCQSSSNQRSYSTFAILTANGRPGPARAVALAAAGFLVVQERGARAADRITGAALSAPDPAAARAATAESGHGDQRWNPDTTPGAGPRDRRGPRRPLRAGGSPDRRRHPRRAAKRPRLAAPVQRREALRLGLGRHGLRPGARPRPPPAP